MSGEYEVLQQAVESARALVLLEAGETGVAFDLAAFRSLSGGMQRALLRDTVARLRAGLQDMDFVPISAAAQLAATGQTGLRAALPGGLSLSVLHSTLVIGPENAPAGLPDIPLLAGDALVPLRIPGDTWLPNSPWRVEARLLAPGRWQFAAIKANLDEWQAFLRWGPEARSQLSLRTRRPGDRFQPLGMGGAETKLADFMTAQKIPLAWRDRLPLLVTEAGQVVWVCGWRVSERVVVREDTHEVLRLKFVRG
jgi:tRNA(Ile)-lysidine synthase